MPPATARLRAVAGVLVTGLLFLAACSTGGEGGAAAPSGSSGQAAAHVNAADSTFLRTMVVNHRAVIALAALARSRSRDPRVRDLAGRLATERESALTTIEAWLSGWGTPVRSPAPGDPPDPATASLRTVSGGDFDRLFVEQMIALWTAAITAADQEVAHGKDPGARQMAKDLTSAYPSAVIDMAQLRTDLGG
jgi:uncharacterized protein (DUF305 family)